MIYESIKSDIVRAMKEKAMFVLQTLRSLDSEIQKKALDMKVSGYTDELVFGVLQKGIKQRQDSIEQFEKGNRADLVQQEQIQLDIYKRYLPKMMSEDEVKDVIRKEITGASENGGNVSLGLIMKRVSPIVKGKADGKLVSTLVQRFINGEIS